MLNTINDFKDFVFYYQVFTKQKGVYQNNNVKTYYITCLL